MSRFMKRILLFVILFGFTSLPGLESFASAAEKSRISVINEGTELKLSVNPIKVKGSVYLHAKSIFDALGVRSTIGKKSIKVFRDDVTYRGEVDQSRIYIGERKLRLSVSPILREGRIFVPARFVEIIGGKDVKYEANSNQIIIGLTPEAKVALQKSLFEAARRGDAEVINNSIKRGADPNGKLIEQFGDQTPLDYAVYNNKTEAVRALFLGGASVELVSGNLGNFAIHFQNLEVLDLLLANGLDPNYKDRMGTLLSTAARIIDISENGIFLKRMMPSSAIVDKLLSYGADPGVDDSLYRAIDAQNFSIIQSLLRAGADPYKTNDYGETAYNLSVSKNINRWLTIQKERTVLPSFRIEDADGTEIMEGGVRSRSIGDVNPFFNYVDFSSGLVYLDAPNGQYQVLHIMVAGNTYIMPQNTSFTITDETINPSTITLPKVNTKITLVSDSIPIIDGYLNLYNSSKSDYLWVPVKGKQVNLYSESGQYRVIGYRDASNNSYNVDSNLMFKGTSEVEDITLVLNIVENKRMQGEEQ